jgi:RNA polymerase sigma-70 factor (ECF subfamily)
MIKAGNTYAFKVLYERYQGQLYSFLFNYINSSKAKDIVQQVFVNIWLNRVNLKDELSIKSYIFTTGKNILISEMRKYTVEMQYIDLQTYKQLQATEDPYQSIYRDELKEIINDLINKLPEKRQQIFRLSREKGLSYKEIAETLNVSVNTVDTQIKRAIKFLKENLKK